MTAKKRTGSRKTTRLTRGRSVAAPSERGAADLPDYVKEQLFGPGAARRSRAARAVARRPSHAAEIPARSEQLQAAAAQITAKAAVPIDSLPQDVRETNRALEGQAHRFHGAKVTLAWFPWRRLASPCADRFGYLTPPLIRSATRLPFDATTIGAGGPAWHTDGRPRSRDRARFGDPGWVHVCGTVRRP